MSSSLPGRAREGLRFEGSESRTEDSDRERGRQNIGRVWVIANTTSAYGKVTCAADQMHMGRKVRQLKQMPCPEIIFTKHKLGVTPVISRQPFLTVSWASGR